VTHPYSHRKLVGTHRLASSSCRMRSLRVPIDPTRRSCHSCNQHTRRRRLPADGTASCWSNVQPARAHRSSLPRSSEHRLQTAGAERKRVCCRVGHSAERTTRPVPACEASRTIQPPVVQLAAPPFAAAPVLQDGSPSSVAPESVELRAYRLRQTFPYDDAPRRQTPTAMSHRHKRQPATATTMHATCA
jgi:hypothetical protein